MKNRKALTLLFIANIVAGVAQGISFVAVPVFFTYQAKGKDVSLEAYWAISVAVIWVLGLFWRLYAGALIDGFRRKDVFLGTNFFAGLIVLSVGLLGYYEPIMPPVLAALVYGTTLFAYFIHFPNLYAYVQEICEPQEYAKWTRYIEVSGQTTKMAAAMLGGILTGGMLIEGIAKWGIHEVFILNGVAHFIAFAIIMFIKADHKKAKNDAAEEAKVVTIADSLGLGMAYLRKNPVVLIFGIVSSAVLITFTAFTSNSLPVYVKNYLGFGEKANEAVVYVSEFWYGAGAMACAFLLRILFKKLHIPMAVIILLLLTTACYVTLVVTRDNYVLFVSMMLVGFADAGTRIYRVLYMYDKVPNRLLGRVQSIFAIPQTLITVSFIVFFGTTYFLTGQNIAQVFLILGGFTFFCALVVALIYKKAL